MIAKENLRNIISLCFYPLTYLSSLWIKLLLKILGYKGRIRGITEHIFMSVGILPIVDDYYYPLINPKKTLKKSLRED